MTGIAGMRLAAEQFPDAVRRAAEREAGDPHARHHDLGGSQVGEVEQHLQHLAGFRANRPTFLAFLNDELQLLRRVVLLGALRLPVDAEKPQQRVADLVEADDEREDERLDPQHRRRDPERHRFGLLQRQRLRDHLADDDVEVREDGDRDDAGEAVRHEPRRRAGLVDGVVDRSRRARARHTCRARGWPR